LDGAKDGAEVGRGWRVGLVVDDIETGLLDVDPGPVGRIARLASPSSTANAIVFRPSFSLLALTISKKPSEIAARGSGPTGSIEKYFG
jgi:hypothetical protein